MRPKSASSRSCQTLPTVIRRFKLNKCGGALAWITPAAHPSAFNFHLCIKLFPVQEEDQRPLPGTWCCSLLCFASLMFFILFCFLKMGVSRARTVPGQWAAAWLPAQVQGQHRASILQLPAMQLPACAGHAPALLLLQKSQLSEKHLTWDDKCLAYRLTHYLNENIFI